MPTAYRVTRADRSVGPVKINDIVYELSGYDYGLSSDDTRYLGIAHISVTLNSDGSYPSFTIPVADLEIIKNQ